MKKIMIFIVLLGMTFPVFLQDLKTGEWNLQYRIIVNQGERGTLFLTKQTGKFESRYIGIKKEDDIPFSYEEKSGEFTDGIYSTMLNFKGKIYDIYYDISRIPPKVAQRIKWKQENKAAIIDRKTLTSSLVFDKIPLVTLENMIIGFGLKQIKEKSQMCLFEEEHGINFLIWFVKVGPEKMNDICDVFRYRCERINLQQNMVQPLFDVLVTQKESIPVRIESAKGRWQFVLMGIGTIERNVYDITEDYKKKALENLAAKGGFDSKVEIVKEKFKNGNYIYNYLVERQLKTYNYQELAYRYFIDKYFGGKSVDGRGERDINDLGNGVYGL